MKAIICPKYGPPEVLQIRDVEKPSPKDDEVLIRIYATAVTASDTYIRGFRIPLRFMIPMRLLIGITKPRKPIIGLVLSGEVERAGKNIRKFRKGDQVYGLTGFGLGAYADYKCMKETDSVRGCLALKPSSASHEEATMLAYGGLLALQYMEKGKIQPGQDVLVYGGSGTTGTLAIQYAKYLGARVTAVCSTKHLELVRSLGADETLDYTAVDTVPRGARYDFMLDAVGKAKTSKLRTACIDALRTDGIYASIDDGNLLLDSKRLDLIRELADACHLKAVLGRTFSFEEMTAAHQYAETGHKTGGIAVTVNR